MMRPILLPGACLAAMLLLSATRSFADDAEANSGATAGKPRARSKPEAAPREDRVDPAGGEAPSASKSRQRLGNSTAAKSARKPHAGDTHVYKAHQLCSAAISVSDYTQILELCQRGVHSGVDEETDAYTRRLMAWAYNRRGELLAEQGHDAMALADFEASIQSDKSRWRAVHNRGVSLALSGKHREAIGDFSRTIELNPRYANAYFNRAEVYYELNEFEAAIRDYSRAIKLEPEDAAFRGSRGHTYHRLGQYREAAHDYTYALRIDPQNADVLVNRGDLYTELGYYKKAVTDYQEAVRSDQNMVRAFLSSAWLMATCPDVQYRSVEGALDAMTKAAKLTSQDDHRFLDILAAVQANAGNYGQARQTIKRAVEAAPQAYQGQYAARVDLYDKRQPFRIVPRPLPEVADSRGQAAGSKKAGAEKPERR